MAIENFLAATYFGNTIFQYIEYLGILAASLIVAKIVTWLTKTIVKPLAAKSKTKADDVIIEILEAPVLFTVFTIAFWLARGLLTLSTDGIEFYNNMLSILIIINVAWYANRLLGSAITHYIQPMTKKTKTDLDDHLIPIAKRLVKIIIFVVAGIMIVDKFGYNVGSLLAGLGLGGLAFALAAKDLVGNLFGGIAILTDKPFKIGDRIKVADVDGYVREIGLRTTRIEGFGGTMYTLPNSKVVDSVTENITAEIERRMVFTIGVEYGTSSAKLEKAKQLISANIKKIKGLNHKNFAIHFSEFASSSLNIRTQYWITQEGLGDYWDVQDKLFTGIKNDFEKAKIEMAFPTTTVHVKK